MKKALALILAVVMCLSLFAACNNAGSPTTTNSTTPSTTGDAASEPSVATNPVTLKVVTMFGGGDSHEKVYRDLNTKFESETGNKINDNSASADEPWKAAVVADFNSGNVPDVLFYFNGATAEPIVESGQLISVKDIQAVDPTYAANVKEDILFGASNTASDGKVYALPLKGFAQGVYVNKTLFAEKNVEIPTSWDTMMTAIEKLNAAGVVPFGTSVGTEPHYFFEHLIISAGGTEALKANPKTVEDVPASWATGLAEIKTLYDAKAFPADTATLKGTEARDLFLQGKAAMYLDGSWANGSIPVASEPKEGLITQDDVQMIAFPCKNAAYQGTVITGVSSGWYITKAAWDDADKRAAAIAYVKMMSSDQAMADYCGPGIGGIAVSDGAAELLKSVDTTPCDAGYTALLAAAGNKVCGPAQDLMTAAGRESAFSNMIQVATGDMTVEDYIKAFMEANAQ